ncbi:MAG: hypothetical protein HYR67_17905 [Bacteroidetes bacterium]|nr:hypothetical protein [Bacteroidota bacterium]
MEQQKSDEIDLGQLFNKIGDFFKSLGYRALKFLAVLRNVPLNNKVLFIALILAGGTLGFYYSSFVKKKFYESSMILSSDYFNKRIVDSSIDKLNLLAAEASSKGLAQVLHISDALASNIISFEAEPFISEKDLVEMEVLKEQLKNAQLNSKNQNVIDQVIKRIEIENRHAFEFTVRTLSPTAITSLQGAFVNYFKNNDYIKNRIRINHDLLVSRKDKLKRDSQKLDSLKRIIYSNYQTMAQQSRQGSNNVILSDKSVTNPVEVYQQDLIIYNQLMFVERDVFLQPDFEVVDGFTEFDSPASAGRAKIVVTAILLAFMLGYVIVAFREFNKYLSTIS